MVNGKIDIGQSLCFYPLGCIHNENCAITGSKASGNFIVKVHMARSINQVKDILFSVLCMIDQTNSLRLNGNTSLSLNIHVIKDLGLHLTAGKRSGKFDHTVCQSGLAVINMRDNTKITNMGLIDCQESIPFFTINNFT